MTRNRIATAIAMFLMLTMTIAMVAFPTVQAQTLPSFLLINVAPNPIGVGQAAEVNAFLSKPPITASLGGTGDMYTGITVEVTKPDGTKQTLGPFTSDATGGTYTTFTPNAVGNYTFKATYRGLHREGWSYP